MPGLPTADPQFWLVTAGAALAVVFLVRRARAKSAPESGATPCEHCAGNAHEHGAARPRAPGPGPDSHRSSP
jgi:hypothetical protein